MLAKSKLNSTKVFVKLLKKSVTDSILSKCAVCNSKKSKFLTEQEARGLLSNLGIKVPILSNIPTVTTLF